MNIALTKTPAEEAFGISLPHRRMEEWRWTDLRARLDRPYPANQNVAADRQDVDRLIASSPFAKINTHRIVFVNGSLDQGRSNFTGLTFEMGVPTSSAVDDPLIHFNGILVGHKLSCFRVVALGDFTPCGNEMIDVVFGRVPSKADTDGGFR